MSESTTSESQSLLAEFVRNGAEAAFRDTAAQTWLIPSLFACWMLDEDTHLARDVTQVVFIELAEEAGKLMGMLRPEAGCIGTPASSVQTSCASNVDVVQARAEPSK